MDVVGCSSVLSVLVFINLWIKVFCTGEFSGEPRCQFMDIARGKPAVQKTTFDSSSADLAVSGDVSCAQTNSSQGNWLVIDLQESTRVCGIGIATLSQEADILSRYEGLVVGFVSELPVEGAEVDMADIQVCGTLPQSDIQQITWYREQCDITARYVIVRQPDGKTDTLTNCRLEVYEFTSPLLACDWSSNLALQRPVAWGDRNNGHNAVDGFPSTWTSTHGCYYSDINQWLAVNLGRDVKLCAISLVNRNGYAYRLSNVIIGFLDTMPETGGTVQSTDIPNVCTNTGSRSLLGEYFTLQCDQETQGSILVLKRPSGNHFTVCEVEVYGYLAKDCLDKLMVAMES